MASACCEGNPMATMKHVNPDDIRTLFSRAMSDMYRAEAPQYGALLDLVADVNDETLRPRPGSKGEPRAGRRARSPERRAPWRHSSRNSAGARRDSPRLRGHGDASSRPL